jgi:catechol 2,3-dioxygenase-like lactoylglutathione lyase family enzyme
MGLLLFILQSEQAFLLLKNMNISRIDHLVLTVQDISRTCEFYATVLGMEVITFGENRWALKFGQQKLNLHQVGHGFEPKAQRPTVGAIDLCLITDISLDEVMEHLVKSGVAIEAGIVQRTGAMGEISSIYIRDPDGNLVEIAHYL